jgi:hypothetical protein
VIVVLAACSKKPAPTPAVTDAATATVTDAVTVTATGDAPRFYLAARVPAGASYVGVAPVAGLDAVGPGEIAIDEDTWTAVVVRPVPPTTLGLAGAKVTGIDNTGPCNAEIHAVFAVRAGEVPFDLRVKTRTDAAARTAAADAVWANAKETRVAVGVTGCIGVAAVPAGTPLEPVKLKAADKDLADKVVDALENGIGADADAKKQLEGMDGEPWDYVSTRVLAPASGAALAVAYIKYWGERSIAVFPVPPIGDNWPIATIAAPAPSTVVGLDADGDGALDAVIQHADGAAIVFARGGSLESSAGYLR